LSDFLTEFKRYMKRDLSAPEQLRLERIKKGQESFREYCLLINPSFFKRIRTYQDTICNDLQAFYENKLINPITGEPYPIFILNVPPGFGKSYTASLFTSWIYGQNNKNQVIEVSYNQSLSIQFSKTVRDLINDEEIAGDPNYFVVRSFFPDVKIKYGDSAMERWSLEGYYNSYLATSFEGSITGMRGSVGIIDDPIKNAVEAVNERVKEGHWNFYKNTFASRILDGGKQIIIQTRWASDDLTGRLLQEFPERCYVLTMQALDENGKSLCEDLYSTKDLQEKKRTLDTSFWMANYEQVPVDIQGALYGKFKTYDAVDESRFERIINYTDTADQGSDSLSSLSGGIIDGYIYITDIYYTDEPMEVTEPELARRLDLYRVRESIIESNNGGRGFARNVISKLKARKNKRCHVTWFHQTKNKRTRILVNASSVMEKIIMPEGWEKKYPEFYKALMGYQRKGKNAHDDAPDGLTGLLEFAIGEVKGIKKARVGNRRRLGL